ncbi:hypothetical protein HYH03_013101 [Edaphochlamys debaryana]|uniref:O-methyltransferase domain-containing protein n=1 Tax=Edaphochlamys debaryana TaxID=47281 RepID=A0A835XNY5_9CHLO|nr:hypothetical protein HYH03_013101 [Edaphochlamys debaryana]|eukprot:KAG2488417.1 hypothetical protein HYH03_013101 [Edaphochlamys debaryana]
MLETLRVEGLSDLLTMSRLYKVSAALNAAAKLDVFTAISEQPQGATVGHLSARLGLCAAPGFRGAADLLDLLVSVGVLEREGDGPEALYRNSQVADRHLVRGRPEYTGGILCLNADRSFPMWAHLPAALREGAMPPYALQRIPDIHTTFGSDVAAAEFFAEGMTGASLGNFQLLAQRFPWARFKSLGDLGGSQGCLCCCVAAAHPHVAATSYDLPAVHAAAERYVAAQGLQGRVQVADLDFFSPSPLPGGHDVLTLGMVLHDWGIDRKMLLLRKAYAALPPGGALIAIDHLVDGPRRSSPVQLGMSLTMLLEFGRENAFDYSFEEFSAWASAVGFSSTELLPLLGTARAAVAYNAANDAALMAPRRAAPSGPAPAAQQRTPAATAPDPHAAVAAGGGGAADSAALERELMRAATRLVMLATAPAASAAAEGAPAASSSASSSSAAAAAASKTGNAPAAAEAAEARASSASSASSAASSSSSSPKRSAAVGVPLQDLSSFAAQIRVEGAGAALTSLWGRRGPATTLLKLLAFALRASEEELGLSAGAAALAQPAGPTAQARSCVWLAVATVLTIKLGKAAPQQLVEVSRALVRSGALAHAARLLATVRTQLADADDLTNLFILAARIIAAWLDATLDERMQALASSALLDHMTRALWDLAGAAAAPYCTADQREELIGLIVHVLIGHTMWAVMPWQRPRFWALGLPGPSTEFMLTAAAAEALRGLDGGPGSGLPPAAAATAARIADGAVGASAAAVRASRLATLYSWTQALVPGGACGLATGGRTPQPQPQPQRHSFLPASAIYRLCLRASAAAVRLLQGGAADAAAAAGPSAAARAAGGSAAAAPTGHGARTELSGGEACSVAVVAAAAVVSAQEALERRWQERWRQRRQRDVSSSEPLRPGGATTTAAAVAAGSGAVTDAVRGAGRASTSACGSGLDLCGSGDGGVNAAASGAVERQAEQLPPRSPPPPPPPSSLPLSVPPLPPVPPASPSALQRPPEWWAAAVAAVAALAALDPETWECKSQALVFEAQLLLWAVLGGGQLAEELPAAPVFGFCGPPRPADPLPRSPPTDVAAALSAGLLPALERLLRRHPRLLLEPPPGEGPPPLRHPAAALLSRRPLSWLLAYGSERQAASLLATLGKVLTWGVSGMRRSPEAVLGGRGYVALDWANRTMRCSLQAAALDAPATAALAPAAATAATAATAASSTPEPASLAAALGAGAASNGTSGGGGGDAAGEQLRALWAYAYARWLPVWCSWGRDRCIPDGARVRPDCAAHTADVAMVLAALEPACGLVEWDGERLDPESVQNPPVLDPACALAVREGEAQAGASAGAGAGAGAGPETTTGGRAGSGAGSGASTASTEGLGMEAAGGHEGGSGTAGGGGCFWRGLVLERCEGLRVLQCCALGPLTHTLDPTRLAPLGCGLLRRLLERCPRATLAAITATDADFVIELLLSLAEAEAAPDPPLAALLKALLRDGAAAAAADALLPLPLPLPPPTRRAPTAPAPAATAAAGTAAGTDASRAAGGDAASAGPGRIPFLVLPRAGAVEALAARVARCCDNALCDRLEGDSEAEAEGWLRPCGGGCGGAWFCCGECEAAAREKGHGLRCPGAAPRSAGGGGGSSGGGGGVGGASGGGGSTGGRGTEGGSSAATAGAGARGGAGKRQGSRGGAPRR